MLEVEGACEPAALRKKLTERLEQLHNLAAPLLPRDVKRGSTRPVPGAALCSPRSTPLAHFSLLGYRSSLGWLWLGSSRARCWLVLQICVSFSSAWLT